MVAFKRSLLIALGLLLTLFVVACGTGANAAGTGYSNTSTMNHQATKQTDQQMATQSNGQQANQTNGQNKKTQKNIQNQAQGNGQMQGQSKGQVQGNGQTVNQNTNKQTTNNQAGNQVTTNQGTGNQTTNNQGNQGNQNTGNQGQNTGNQGNQGVGNQSTGNQGNNNVLISTASVMINGSPTTVLVTATGQTLYYRTSDPAPESSCTGACAQAWPPAIANGMVISTSALPGTLTVHMTANGNQIEYNGHPLYTYANDTVPGQANGQGAGNIWYVIPIKLQPQHW